VNAITAPFSVFFYREEIFFDGDCSRDPIFHQSGRGTPQIERGQKRRSNPGQNYVDREIETAG
jgi:hypothetical protein